jgi:hypothetical protein
LRAGHKDFILGHIFRRQVARMESQVSFPLWFTRLPFFQCPVLRVEEGDLRSNGGWGKRK